MKIIDLRSDTVTLPSADMRQAIFEAQLGDDVFEEDTSVNLLEKKEDMLRMWHFMDPPDTWEINRNSLIEQKQGNKNPFIDHTELVERVKSFY